MPTLTVQSVPIVLAFSIKVINGDLIAIFPARFSMDGLLTSSIVETLASISSLIQFQSSTATKESKPYATTGFFVLNPPQQAMMMME